MILKTIKRLGIGYDEFVGKVTAVKAVAALNADAVSKEEFQDVFLSGSKIIEILEI